MRRLGRKPRPDELTFGPTSGGISGIIGVICGLGLAVLTLPHGLGRSELPFLFGGLAFAALSWAMLLRPRVRLHVGDLELRNGFSDFRIPYAAISDVAVRSFTVVRVGQQRYIGLAVGRTRTSMTRRRKDDLDRPRPGLSSGRSLVGASEAELFEASLDERVRHARGGDAHPVTRHWALPELVALGIFVAGFVVSLFVI